MEGVDHNAVEGGREDQFGECIAVSECALVDGYECLWQHDGGEVFESEESILSDAGGCARQLDAGEGDTLVEHVVAHFVVGCSVADLTGFVVVVIAGYNGGVGEVEFGEDSFVCLARLETCCHHLAQEEDVGAVERTIDLQ